MPSTPLTIAIVEDVRDALNGMSRAAGYWFDYGLAMQGKYNWEAEDSWENPRPHYFWTPSPGDDDTAGGELATSRVRREDVIHISVHVRAEDDDLLTRMMRVEADLHKAVMADRGRDDNANTFHATSEATYYAGDGKDVLGGTVTIRVHLIWYHATGDMTTL